MKTFFTAAKPLLLHLVGFIAATLLASTLANVVLENYPAGTGNASYAVKGGFNLVAVLFSYSLINFWLYKNNNQLSRLWHSKVLVTLLVSVSSLGIVLALLFSFDLYQITQLNQNNELVIVFIALFAQAASQEVLFRGIFYGHLVNHFSWLKLAVIFALLLAGLNILVDGVYIQPFVATFFIHFILCLLYQYSANLWLPIVAYFGWIYVTFLTGVLDEHWRISAPMVTEPSANSWLSGGSFGPESSVLGLLVMVCFTFFLLKKLSPANNP